MSSLCRVASRLACWNPAMTFVYVSGAGTDSSERGRSMWARVKGATESALLRLSFKAAYMLGSSRFSGEGGLDLQEEIG